MGLPTRDVLGEEIGVRRIENKKLKKTKKKSKKDNPWQIEREIKSINVKMLLKNLLELGEGGSVQWK